MTKKNKNNRRKLLFIIINNITLVNIKKNKYIYFINLIT